MLRLGILASGRGSNAEALLAAIEAGELEMEAAVVVCDRPGAAVIDVAVGHSVAVELITRAGSGSRAEQQLAIRDALVRHRVDAVALAGFAAILDPVVVDAFEGRILNIHPSLLPAFAGTVAPEPQAAALRGGVEQTGCTVHVVTNTVDAGPIVAQASVAVRADDTVESLSDRILAEEHRLYPRVLQWIAEGRVHVADGGATVDPHRP